jgi:NADH:ubiquinone oxidoreductase subunit C
MTSQSDDLIRNIENTVKGLGGEVQSSTKDAITVKLPTERLIEATRAITEQHGLSHLSTMTGLDSGDSVEVLYHFWKGDVIASLRISVPKSSIRAPSIVEVVPGAILYEMEVHDMFGVVFDGNPWMDRKLLLPDNYPPDLPPPLLKGTKTSEIRKAVGVDR